VWAHGQPGSWQQFLHIPGEKAFTGGLLQAKIIVTFPS